MSGSCLLCLSESKFTQLSSKHLERDFFNFKGHMSWAFSKLCWKQKLPKLKSRDIKLVIELHFPASCYWEEKPFFRSGCDCSLVTSTKIAQENPGGSIRGKTPTPLNPWFFIAFWEDSLMLDSHSLARKKQVIGTGGYKKTARWSFWNKHGTAMVFNRT